MKITDVLKSVDKNFTIGGIDYDPQTGEGELKMKKEVFEIKAKVVGLDEATEKVEKYIELLEKAKTLADELASVEFELVFGED
ncbi:hypothetical protein [Enterococcus entomosocium]|uniref:hypothetical protein n=1 Tax=Enterococcus entomosocium TaxID=3034352 RepID=UPI002648A3AB|nr:hypothetical protein [Enterococcus entomosocium]